MATPLSGYARLILSFRIFALHTFKTDTRGGTVEVCGFDPTLLQLGDEFFIGHIL